MIYVRVEFMPASCGQRPCSLINIVVSYQTVVDFSGAFALSDWLMLLSQHSMALRLLFPSFPADSADSQQLDSNSLESIEIEPIAQIPTSPVLALPRDSPLAKGLISPLSFLFSPPV
jgi:hypothetical protein